MGNRRERSRSRSRTRSYSRYDDRQRSSRSDRDRLDRDRLDEDRDRERGQDRERDRERSPGRDRHDRKRERGRDRSPPSRLSEERKGLNIEVHPLLAKNVDIDTIKTGSIPLIPKASISTVLANQRAATATSLQPKSLKGKASRLDPVAAFLKIKPEEPKRSNPYFDPRLAGPAEHRARPIHFQPKGKFAGQAQQMRKAAKMDVLRREIAEESLQSGLDVDIVGDLIAMGPEMVPQVEWWDRPFLPDGVLDLAKTNYAILNNLVQRPGLIEPPADLNVLVAPKPLALTKEELKKMRRQRRLQEQKDKQEQIRLGLLPPEEPKIKLTNIKTVLANETAQDPTKVEAEIRAKIAARHEAHLKANEERKLEADAQPKERPQVGPVTNVAVFKVNRIDHNQWKYKIRMNAQQDHLTGCAIYSPKTNLIVVEGAMKGLKHYKTLLMRRIDWSEVGNAPGAVPEPTLNECKLLWEGVVAKPSWTRFEIKEAKADIDVKDYLVSLGLEHYWNLVHM